MLLTYFLNAFEIVIIIIIIIIITIIIITINNNLQHLALTQLIVKNLPFLMEREYELMRLETSVLSFSLTQFTTVNIAMPHCYNILYNSILSSIPWSPNWSSSLMFSV